MHSAQLQHQVGHKSSQQTLAQLAHAATGSQEQDQFLRQPAVHVASPRQEVCSLLVDLHHCCLHMAVLVLALRGSVCLQHCMWVLMCSLAPYFLGCVPSVSVGLLIRQTSSEMCSPV